MKLAAMVVAGVLCACGGGDADPDARARRKLSKPVEDRVDISKARLHTVHTDGLEKLACTECHDLAAEEFSPPAMDKCEGCHEGHDSVEHRKCTEQCHSFTARTGATPSCDSANCHGGMSHGDAACSMCHQTHAPIPAKSAVCADCHEDTHAGKHDSCLDCHGTHENAEAANDRCASCHGKLVGSHDRCAQCHDVHDADSKPRTCGSCHSDVEAGSHMNCRNCHEPHDPFRKARSCNTCHSKLTRDHPSDPRAGECLSCHRMHPNNEASVAPCSSCHGAAMSDTDFHANKVECASCHVPHKTDKACASCHEPQAEGGRTHANCANCHKPHTPKDRVPSCQTCHAVQRRTAPRGHTDCSTCHETHTGKLAKGAACIDCHEKQAATVHGKQVKGGCVSCHRPHGPRGRATPPTCATCHVSMPGLHRTSEHTQCAGCHDDHGATRRDRRACLTCHEDQERHEPTAKTCYGCHPFGGSL